MAKVSRAVLGPAPLFLLILSCCQPEFPPVRPVSPPAASAALGPSPVTGVGTPRDTVFRGVSLRRLNAFLSDCVDSGTCQESALGMGGLKVLDGYVTDDRDNDVVLFGRDDGAKPSLKTEDLAVALRNAWRKYVRREGNTLYFSNPSCTINPDPAVMRALDEVGGRIFRGVGDLREWERVCKRPQTVEVMGVPFQTRFARVMVEADYAMKSIVDGGDPRPIPGLVSLSDRTLEHFRRQALSDPTTPIAASFMNRFWFYPGENLYEEADGMVFIRRSPVTLRSNATYLDSHGELSDSISRDPLAEDFASDFTHVFAEVARQKPIMAELEGLFRWTALSRIAESKLRGGRYEEVLSHLLERLPVPVTPVDRTKPGRPGLKSFEERRRVPGGERIMTFRLPSCGGVDIDIKGRFRRSRLPSLPGFVSAVLRGKSETDSFTWRVQDREGGPTAELRDSMHTTSLNRGDSKLPVYFVRDSTSEANPELYTMFSARRPTPDQEQEKEDIIYRGSDFDAMLRALIATGEKNVVLWREMSTEDRNLAFDTTFQIHRAELPTDVSIHVYQERGDTAARPAETVGIREGTIERVTSGRWKDGFRQVIQVARRAGAIVRTFKISVQGATQATVSAVVAKIREWLQFRTNGAPNLGDLPGYLHDTMGYPDGWFELLIKEIGNIDIGFLCCATEGRAE